MPRRLPVHVVPPASYHGDGAAQQQLAPPFQRVGTSALTRAGNGVVGSGVADVLGGAAPRRRHHERAVEPPEHGSGAWVGGRRVRRLVLARRMG